MIGGVGGLIGAVGGVGAGVLIGGDGGEGACVAATRLIRKPEMIGAAVSVVAVMVSGDCPFRIVKPS